MPYLIKNALLSNFGTETAMDFLPLHNLFKEYTTKQ